MIDEIIGRVAFSIIESKLGNSAEGERPFFRIKNVSVPEAEAFLSCWNEKCGGTALEPMTVIVSSSFTGRIDDSFKADPEKSITWYRDNNECGLIYIETKVESDAQGLKSIFSLSDRDFLNGKFDEDGFHVPTEFVATTWSLCGGNEKGIESLFCQRLVEVLSLIHPSAITVPVRSYVAFVLSAVSERLNHDSLTPDETDALIGNSLLELRMFPDPAWRRDSSEARRRGRLKLNALHADLAATNSSDLDIDKLIEKIKTTSFRDEEGNALSESENQEWRKLCIDYCLSPVPERRKKVPYPVFEQILQKIPAGLKLGDRVAMEISNVAPSREAEFESLGIKVGLDRRNIDEARRFLEEDPKEETDPRLAEILSVQTRRMVEKVANPRPESFENPLTKIAEIANVFSARNGDVADSEDLVISVKPGIDDDAPSFLAAFFSLIYGPTLRAVVEETAAVDSGMQLEIDERLLTVSPVPELKSDEDDEDHDPEVDDWAPLPIEFRLIDRKKDREVDSEVSYVWIPDSLSRMIFLWYAYSACDQPAALSFKEDGDLDEWLVSVLRRDVDLREHAAGEVPAQVADNPLVKEFKDLREKFAAEVSASGFIQGSISQFVTDWTELLDQAKNEWVPDGKRDERIDWLFSADRLELKSGDALILPSHPFKLRWLAEYLRTSEELLTKALNDELLLNSQNGKFYLDWISGLSSREQPPVACNAKGKYIFASSSEGWAEDLTGLDPEKSDSDLGGLDSSSEDEIVSLLRTYLNSHPYKVDGFSVVILIEHGASLAADLFRKLRTGEFKVLKASVHMIAPPSLWPDISRSFDELPGESRMFGGSVFPPVQLSFYDSTNEAGLEEALEGMSCDVAILPGILDGNLEIQAMTESPGARLGGNFHPLFHQAVHYSSGTQGKAISISMRPEKPDRAMDAWSTLAVRQERTKPVAPNQPDNYDYVEVKIDFTRTAHIFEILHNTAHWVVTVERHISKEQIENLDAKPDILTMKEGIGAGGLLTMIVSSSCGREFILSRLARKLQRIVRDCGDSNPIESVTTALAEKIYEETRHISPVLALQAMGISRVTEEMLGVAIARNVANEKFPVNSECAVSIWISMDEHAEWFGGTTSIRPDLCRVTLTAGNERTELSILVVEGKLRQSYDAHGEQQVISALNLFNQVFHCEEDAEPVDARLWREKLCAAVQNASPEARELHGEFDDIESSLSSMLEDLAEGWVEAHPVEGLFSICLYSTTGEFEISQSSNEAMLIAKSFGNNVIALIERNLEEVEKDSGAAMVPAVEETAETDSPAVSTATPPEGTGETDATTAAVLETSPEPGNDLVTKMQTEAKRGKLSHADLTERFQVILDTYGKFSISVEKPKKIEDCFVEGPASILYRIKPATGVDPKSIYAKGDSLKLELELEEHQSIRFSISRGNIEIDVPKLNEDRYFVDAFDMWTRWTRPDAQLEVPLGEDRKGKVVSLNFSTSTAPHLLIGGTTGSGKSEALNTILHGMTRFYSSDELKLKLIDPKSTELVSFEDCDHLIGEIESDAESAIALLEEAVDEMQARYSIFKAGKVKSIAKHNENVAVEERLPWWVIVLDEYADLTTEKSDKAEIEKLLKRLAQKARAAGIHVIIATQKPSAEVISTNLRSNLPAQLALRVKSSTESRVIMDDSGAETLNGKGDAFLKTVEGLERIQCALVEED